MLVRSTLAICKSCRTFFFARGRPTIMSESPTMRASPRRPPPLAMIESLPRLKLPSPAASKLDEDPASTGRFSSPGKPSPLLSPMLRMPSSPYAGLISQHLGLNSPLPFERAFQSPTLHPPLPPSPRRRIKAGFASPLCSAETRAKSVGPSRLSQTSTMLPPPPRALPLMRPPSARAVDGRTSPLVYASECRSSSTLLTRMELLARGHLQTL